MQRGAVPCTSPVCRKLPPAAFSTPCGAQVIDLKPEGRTIPVTDDNKLEYVQLLCEHHMSPGPASVQ